MTVIIEWRVGGGLMMGRPASEGVNDRLGLQGELLGGPVDSKCTTKDERCVCESKQSVTGEGV